MQELLDMFYVEGDILQTVCKLTVLLIGLVVCLDVIYILKSAIKTSSF